MFIAFSKDISLFFDNSCILLLLAKKRASTHEYSILSLDFSPNLDFSNRENASLDVECIFSLVICAIIILYSWILII